MQPNIKAMKTPCHPTLIPQESIITANPPRKHFGSPRPSRSAINALFLGLLICFQSLLHAEQPCCNTQIFTDGTGRQLEAVILGKTADKVSLRRVADGRTFVLSIDTLSKQDQEQVRGWQIPEPGYNELGNKVVKFAWANLGRRVGRGQCAHLAVEALKAAGADGMRPDFPRKGDYVWGELVVHIQAAAVGVMGTSKLGDIHPGDIVQLRNVRFEGRRGCRGTYRSNADHHTVIIERVDVARGYLHILHQNVNGVKKVRRDAYRIADLKQGWLRVYRPVSSGSLVEKPPATACRTSSEEENAEAAPKKGLECFLNDLLTRS